MSVQERDVLAAMSTVMDPDLNQNLVQAGMVKDLRIEGGSVKLRIELTTPACPLKDKIKADAEAALKKVAGVQSLAIEMTAQVRAKPTSKDQLLPQVKNVLLVGAGKGGVGKSTVALNLACALARHGATVGLLDADFYGPSVPVMTGVNKRPVSRDGKVLEPIDVHGIKVMSIGFLIEADQALIWRGPMLQGALMQLVRDVNWGELDYLVVDLPPGTGDIPLTVAQQLKSSGAVLVTTPQDVALADVIRAKQMFDKLNIPILGIVENMSQFICPHCGKGTHIFDTGGGKKASDMMEISFLGEVPLELSIRQGGDKGLPIVVGQPDGAEGQAFMGLAQKVAQRVSVENAARTAPSVTMQTA
ncbi:MAG TPA: Mrp/NBP35 family ATP-binding protein [Archangium sp.]